MKKYRTKFKTYFDDLAAKKPAPGGGSAACLIFCLGVSLLEKAIRYSLTGEKITIFYRTKEVLAKLSALQKKIALYIDLDGEIFENIMRSKGRQRVLLLKKSEQLIVETAKACYGAFLLAKGVESGIKKGISSDFFIGKESLSFSLKGCIYNLEANKNIFGRPNKFIKIFKMYIREMH
ncbi:MAG: cyclodeaminase/cyclohydrolase family protein [Candidatus Omnitrophica bacterium]|nr:cyclodeaminase/cyclohydrolase family protein [Candidatus Omnitrophota bacterium]